MPLCNLPTILPMRHRGDSNPCGQSPMDFESISLTARTQCLEVSFSRSQYSVAHFRYIVRVSGGKKLETSPLAGAPHRLDALFGPECGWVRNRGTGTSELFADKLRCSNLRPIPRQSACSVAASYKPPMLMTRARLPACAMIFAHV